MQSIRVISSSCTRSLRTIRPCGGSVLRQISSTGWSLSIHWEPCKAAAATPATTARRFDHSHAAYALSSIGGSMYLST
jgi:hypothetical protein